MTDIQTTTGRPLVARERYGPWAVVTGASSGIGREMAIRLAEAGLNLVLVARRRHALDELARETSAAHGIETMVLDADLSRREGVDAVIEATRTLDVGLLVANAGYGTTGPLVDTDLADELDMIGVNIDAVLILSHAFGGRLRDRGRGGIILMSSVVAFQGVPRSANYAATKAYVQSLAEGLRVELEPHGVDVLVSAPGPVESGFAARAGMTLGKTSTPDQVAEGTLRALGRRSMVRPGGLSKALGLALGTAPRRLRVRIMTGIMEGFTRHETGAGRTVAADSTGASS